MFKAYVMIKRKPGTTLEDFITYYENKHAPLAVKMVPGLRRYVRHYLRNWENGTYRSDMEAPYDVVTEIWFDDRAAFDVGMAHLTSPETAAVIGADEEKVFDRQSITFLTVDDERETDPSEFI
ncbi:EthD domain-containing protein [Rhodococcus sp. 14C212]|uniref:EthD domain-containing protein n=1 Tax=Rhodococcus sp. 14C212 TaxID=2711209 RepID=UPI0013ECEB19|nr:EthD domain-containing protein [Rhodococcus sp. 14C212]NGP06042.1 EthD domain-containing protein [Rhodococcus sp. 14C212]